MQLCSAMLNERSDFSAYRRDDIVDFDKMQFIAPEVFSDDSSGRSRPCDCWSLGVMLFALLVGHPPWAGSHSFMQVMRRMMTYAMGDAPLPFPQDNNIEAAAKEVVAGLMQADVTQRYSCIPVVSSHEEPVAAPLLWDHPWMVSLHPPGRYKSAAELLRMLESATPPSNAEVF